jgi:hypothetical protein
VTEHLPEPTGDPASRHRLPPEVAVRIRAGGAPARGVRRGPAGIPVICIFGAGARRARADDEPADGD